MTLYNVSLATIFIFAGPSPQAPMQKSLIIYNVYFKVRLKNCRPQENVISRFHCIYILTVYTEREYIQRRISYHDEVIYMTLFD